MNSERELERDQAEPDDFYALADWLLHQREYIADCVLDDPGADFGIANVQFIIWDDIAQRLMGAGAAVLDTRRSREFTYSVDLTELAPVNKPTQDVPAHA